MKRLCFTGLALAILIIGGCILTSATFVVSETFIFQTHDDFYFHRVDVTNTDTWQDHSDDIDFIDAVGFIMFARNLESSDISFSLYVDDYSEGTSIPDSIPTGSATQVLENLAIPPGESVVTYAESVKNIKNIDRLRTLAKEGKFDCFVTSTGGTGSTFVVDSIIVVVTLTAG